jgi:hypothetical protein
MNTASVTSTGEGTLLPQKQHSCLESSLVIQGLKSGRRDLNPRPLEPHSSALPSCATARWSEYCLPLLGRRQTFPSDAMKAIIPNRVCACSIAVAILLCATGTMLAQPRTRLRLNEDGFAFAVHLVHQGHFIADGKGAWSEHRPSADEENEFIHVHGFSEYAKWHLELTIATPRTPNGDTNFPMATSKTFIAVGCLRRKREPTNTAIPKSKTRPPSSSR